ncbi:Antibiotic biosynthesis monooxygenase [Aquimixticola soesokkakensis]|uniref:Antibiotic biosynthesis monooxygenase n=1 Tax=Aquimixticola soesokkakensis TaxID=1519096 RepID=A0A1Y5SJH1_9RHOB|nr:putative quinol monooxygenase [Aquimixticola soesokkakensis]SLN41870.1 Antibiotic biosynthesis monooxygenase [Aquimixticola soesokkakensis]
MSRVMLTGTLTCAPTEVEDLLSLMAKHIRLSRNEPGCLDFDLWQDELTPHVFHLSEVFRSEAALQAHQDRTHSSDWGRVTKDMRRDFKTVHL